MRVQTVKLPKGVTQEFVDNIQAMTSDQLKAEVVRLQMSNQENEEFKTSLEFVQAQSEFEVAKDIFDLVVGPIRDTTVSLKNRTKLVIERLKEKGIS